jgi:hypothetical protein
MFLQLLHNQIGNVTPQGQGWKGGDGTVEGRGRPSSKPRSKVFNMFSHDMQSDLADGMVVEATVVRRVEQNHIKNKQPESEATPQPEIACMALFSFQLLLFHK